MTEVPKKPGRPATGQMGTLPVKAGDDLKKAFDAAAKAAGSDRSKITRQLWAWYAGLPGAELPERPGS